MRADGVVEHALEIGPCAVVGFRRQHPIGIPVDCSPEVPATFCPFDDLGASDELAEAGSVPMRVRQAM
jgi:hypothetical protein